MAEPENTETSQEQDRTLLKVLPIAIVVALGLLFGSYYFGRIQIELLSGGERTKGVVIDFERGSSSATSSGGSPAWFPIVTFNSLDGSEVTFRHRTGRNPPGFEVGEEVSVIYLPNSPDVALIDEGFWNWLLPLVLGTVGTLLLVGSLRGFMGVRRRLSSVGERRGL